MEDKEIKVSIITVSYNAVKTIEQTMRSVLEQSYKNIEYLIIDGKSTDGTQEIIEKYQDRLAYYVSEQDEGIYDAMNKGICRATGDVIGIINSDDWYQTNVIEKVVKCFNNTSAEVVYGEIWLLDHNDRRRRCTRHSAFPPHPTMFVKRDIYQKYGMFDTNYKIAADYELTLRFFSNGVLFENIGDIISNFRMGGISTRKKMLCAEETRQIRLKYIDHYPNKALDLCMIEEVYARNKLLYISQNNPEKILRELRKKFPELEQGIVIFGTGNWGKELYTVLQNCDIYVPCFVDNDDTKWEFEFDGTRVCPPEILQDSHAYVLIAVKKYREEILMQLQEYSNENLVVSMYTDLLEMPIKDMD